MATARIVRAENLLLESNLLKLSSFGFDCDIALNQLIQLRDDNGRIQELDSELLDDNGHQIIKAKVYIHSIRRISQTEGIVSARFSEVTLSQREDIAEYLATGKVVSILQHQKRRA